MNKQSKTLLLTAVLLLSLLVVFGCKTKKTVTIDNRTERYDSTITTHQETDRYVTIVDTTTIDECTEIIREYVFSNQADSITAIHTDSLSVPPMLMVQPDGSIAIRYGLKAIKERMTRRKAEQRHINTSDKTATKQQSRTNVSKKQEVRTKAKQTIRFDVMFVIYIGIAVSLILFILAKYKKR